MNLDRSYYKKRDEKQTTLQASNSFFEWKNFFKYFVSWILIALHISKCVEYVYKLKRDYS